MQTLPATRYPTYRYVDVLLCACARTRWCSLWHALANALWNASDRSPEGVVFPASVPARWYLAI